MKYLNYILSILVALLFFTEIVYAEPGGDLNLTNKANLSSRTGYDLTLGTESTSDTIDFVIGGTREGYIDSTGLVVSGGTFTSPTIAGNLTFSTAAAKIIPGATSLTFRNNADSADNLAITNAGVVTVRSNLLATTADSQTLGTAAIPFNPLYWGNGTIQGALSYSGGNSSVVVGSLSNHSLEFRTNTGTRWIINTSGTITQDATNGGSIIMSKASTYLLNGATSIDADVNSANKIITVTNTTTAGPNQFNLGNGANATGSDLVLAKTRGTGTDANTTVNDGDTLGGISFYGADGTGYIQGAIVRALVDGAPGTNDMNSRLEFLTTANGGTTAARRIYIGQSGDLVQDSTNGNNWTMQKVGSVLNMTATGITLAVDSGTAASACKGTTTTNGTTAVTVSTTCAATGAIVFAQRTSDPGGTTAADCWTTNIVNGTSFDIDCDDADDSTWAWWILKEG